MQNASIEINNKYWHVIHASLTNLTWLTKNIFKKFAPLHVFHLLYTRYFISTIVLYHLLNIHCKVLRTQWFIFYRILQMLFVDFIYTLHRCTRYYFTCILKYVYPMADLGGVPGARPPYGTNSFVFTHIFGEKCPHRRSTPPLREILDPPLVSVLFNAYHYVITYYIFGFKL